MRCGPRFFEDCMVISKVQSQAEAREALDEMETLRKRAARQAAAVLDETNDAPKVAARVLPLGDGKVSMGKHVAGIGEAYYEKGEVIPELPEPVAKTLEARGYVEIQP